MIKLFETRIGDEEIEAIKRVAKTNWLGEGKETKLFEKELGNHFLRTNSCTSALIMALQLSNAGSIIVPTIAHPAIMGAIGYSLVTPIFADVDPHTLNILPSEIARLTIENSDIMVLHYGGHPANMDAIMELATGKVIEDNACSPASKYKGRPCGQLGDIGCYSFDSMKIMTTVDGGAIWLHNNWDYQRALRLRQYGLKAESGLSSLGKHKWWEIEIDEPSGRYITNDILSAIGRVQFRKLDGFITRRKIIWDRYQWAFKELGGITCPPEPEEGCYSSYYYYWLQLEDRDRFARYLIDHNIYCSFRYYPLHLVFKTGDRLPKAEWAAEHTINIPIHQYLTDDEVDYIITTIRNFKDGL